MTSRARAERRRAERRRAERNARRPTLTRDPEVGVLVGWCATADDIPAARAGTHDALIALMGNQRSGPVTWLELTGSRAHEFLDRALAEPDNAPEIDRHYRHLRTLLADHDGWLVIAAAPGVIATAPAPSNGSAP
jgi:hypothetical protein